MDADPATLTEPERRIALLDWLARGRDVRIAAELCGEKHDWAKAVAAAAGHPDRDKVRQALAEAKGRPAHWRSCGCPWPSKHTCTDPIPPSKPDTMAPTRPVVTRTVVTIGDELGPALAPAGTITVCGPDVIDESGGAERCTRRPDCPWTGGGECGDCLGDDLDADGNLRDGDGELVEDEDGAPLPNLHHVDPSAIPSALAAAEHVHAPHLVLEGRVWHAICDACGTTWHRTRCTAPGCGAYVSANYIALTGSTRHDWHPKEQS